MTPIRWQRPLGWYDRDNPIRTKAQHAEAMKRMLDGLNQREKAIVARKINQPLAVLDDRIAWVLAGEPPQEKEG